MYNLKNIPEKFIIPNQSDLETYRHHCILLPLDKFYNVTSYQKKSGKDWKQEFFAYLFLSNKNNFPEKSKKEHLVDTDNNFNNLLELIKNNMDELTPSLSLAYPIANCWIIVFYADFFDKSIKNIDLPKEIIQSNYDPILHSFTNFKG